VLGIPLLAGFVMVLSGAIAMVGPRPADSAWKWIVVAELGLLPLPGVAVVATLVTPGQQHGATTLPMVLWCATYAAGFALAALRARSVIGARTTDFERSLLAQRWSVPLTLFAWAMLVIAFEGLVCRPL
jgi:hypothetical protein